MTRNQPLDSRAPADASQAERQKTLSTADMKHLRRCLELAREALGAGDEPFGSVLVDARGETVFEDRNRVKDGDQTRHPEFEIARWAARNMTSEERAKATVYTSGEHCPMCSAAHAWVQLGRIVYAASGEQFSGWMSEWDVAPGPVAALPIQAVAPGILVAGPAAEFAEELKEMYRRYYAH